MALSKQDSQGARTAADIERKYSFGKSFAEVFGLAEAAQASADAAQKAADEAQEAADNANEKLTSEEIFNILTNNGVEQGIYRGEDGKIYINGTYIQAGQVVANVMKADAMGGQWSGFVSSRQELNELIINALQDMPSPGVKHLALIVSFGYVLLDGYCSITITKGEGGYGGTDMTALLVSSNGEVRVCYGSDRSGDGWSLSWAEVPPVILDLDTGCYKLPERNIPYGLEAWINPPMVIGTEYPTIERWNGNIVYRKLIDFGALPNTSTKRVAHGLSIPFSNVIGMRVVAHSSDEGEMAEIPIGYSGAFAAYAFCESENVAIRTTTDMSSYTAVVELKYMR